MVLDYAFQHFCRGEEQVGAGRRLPLDAREDQADAGVHLARPEAQGHRKALGQRETPHKGPRGRGPEDQSTQEGQPRGRLLGT